MPVAPINDKGSVFYYEDSGAPADNTEYVTLVLIHGTCFHGAVFRPLLPFAAANNLRLVFCNMRGYPGSTPFSTDELLEMKSEPRAAMRARGLEVAHFLRWLVEITGIPPLRQIPSGKLVGGLSLLAWSGGNVPMLSTFAHVGELQTETRDMLGGYLRSFIMYDPPNTVTGESLPPNYTTLALDRSLPIEDLAHQFCVQVGSFHPPFRLPDSLDEALSRPHRAAMQNTPTPLDFKYTPTTLEPKMSPEVLREITYPPILNTQPTMWTQSMQDAVAENVSRALYDCRLADGTSPWRKARAHVVWCDMSLSEVAWAVTKLKLGHEKADPDAKRPMELHVLEGANHFVHWEEPEMFVPLLADIV